MRTSSRRRYLAAIAISSLGAGCGIFPQEGTNRDLWKVSVGSVSLAQLQLSIEPERKTATTKDPATVQLQFQNPQAETWILNHGTCPEIDETTPGLILFPKSLEPDFHPEPITEKCWKPDPESYYYPCETIVPETKIQSGQSWSIVQEIWIEEEEDCIPSGTFTFNIHGHVQNDDRGPKERRIGEFSLIIEPIVTTNSSP